MCGVKDLIKLQYENDFMSKKIIELEKEKAVIEVLKSSILKTCMEFGEEKFGEDKFCKDTECNDVKSVVIDFYEDEMKELQNRIERMEKTFKEIEELIIYCDCPDLIPVC